MRRTRSTFTIIDCVAIVLVLLGTTTYLKHDRKEYEKATVHQLSEFRSELATDGFTIISLDRRDEQKDGEYQEYFVAVVVVDGVWVVLTRTRETTGTYARGRYQITGIGCPGNLSKFDGRLMGPPTPREVAEYLLRYKRSYPCYGSDHTG